MSIGVLAVLFVMSAEGAQLPITLTPDDASGIVSMGFLDRVCPSGGIWTAFNQIPGPKEVVPLVNAAHNHESTPEQQQAYTDRSNAWMAALLKGEEATIN